MNQDNSNIVRENSLITPSGMIEVGSNSWLEWLCANAKFKYTSKDGHFTAQAEKRRNGTYWYAYRKRHGKLEKMYLGKPEQLTHEKLVNCCKELSRPNLLTDFLENPTEAENQINEEIRIDNPAFPMSKVDVPMLPKFLVSRQKLVQQISTPIVLIHAPSGFGKSTLLNEWRQGCGFPVAWLAIDKDDNYRSRFFFSIIKAIQNIDPTFGNDLISFINTTVNTQITEIVPKLTEEISKLAHKSLKLGLVLDDIHHIHNQDIFDSLQAWINNLPPNLMLIISGQNRPPLLLGDLRARSYITELDVSDLRFSKEEGIHYLEKFSRKQLHQSDYERLSTHAEGWAAGLTLTALALAKQEDPQQFVENFSGAHIYMREYFMETVLQRLSPEVQTFLLKTSILKHICGSLANAVTETENGDEILAKLWDESLFIVKLEQPGWYRYHDLFSEMLQSQLKLRNPAEVDTLHMIAARWYYNQIATADAIYHLLATKAWDEAALLIEEMAFRELEQFGEDSRLLRWLQELPIHVVQNHKNLLYVYLRLAYHAMPPQKIERFVTHVENSLLRKPGPSLTIDEREMLNEIKLLRNHWEDQDEFSLPLTGDSHSERWRLLVDMHILRPLRYDDQVKVDEKIQDVFDRSLQQKNLFVTLMAGGALARRAFNFGHLRQAEKFARHTLEVSLSQRGKLPEPSSISFSQLCRMEIERNDLLMAQKYLTQVSEVDPNPTSYNMPVATAINQTLIHLARKEYAKAKAVIQEIRVHHEKRPSGQFMDQELIAYEALVFLREGNLKTTRQLLAEAEAMGEHLLPKLVLSELLLRRQQPDLAEYYLNEILPMFPGEIQTESITSVLLLRALALYNMGQTSQGKALMIDLIKNCAMEKSVRSFLDRLDLCKPILQDILINENIPQFSRIFIKELLLNDEPNQFGEPTERKQNADGSGISAREKEVLSLMSYGDSNREMAVKLSVSESTIKTHITNIFTKLQVNNRVQAIMQARKNNLI